MFSSQHPAVKFKCCICNLHDSNITVRLQSLIGQDTIPRHAFITLNALSYRIAVLSERYRVALLDACIYKGIQIYIGVSVVSENGSMGILFKDIQNSMGGGVHYRLITLYV